MPNNIGIIGHNEEISTFFRNNNYNIRYFLDSKKARSKGFEGVDLIVVNDVDLFFEIPNTELPILFCVPNFGEIEKVIERGGLDVFDYIIESFRDHELTDKIDRLIKVKKYKDEVGEAERKNDKLVRMLREANTTNKKLMIKAHSLEEESSLDPLSNVYNRKYTMKRLDEEIGRTKRYERKFAIALVDVVNINTINKKYGHITGDDTIAKVSKIIEEAVRTSDIVGRIRGDTFLVILPEIIESYSIKVVERIVEKIENCKIRDVQLNAFAGFAIMDKFKLEGFDNSNEMLVLMDKLLIFARQSNKQIVEYNDESVQSINKIKEYVLRNELEDKHNLILEELAKSKKFIERMLPREEEWKSKLKYSYLYFPFNFIGGDFFDFIQLDENKMAILFCDVSGHGVSAALYITAIKYMFRNAIHKDGIIEPATFMKVFNNGILELAEQNIFVATTYGIYDRKEKRFTYSYGGGTVPMKIDKKNGKLEMLAEGGFVIGLFEDAEFETKEIQLNEGDFLFFYSDGIYEFLIESGVMKDDGEFFEVVKSNIEKNNESDFITSLYAMMKSKMTENVEFNDDITVLAIQA